MLNKLFLKKLKNTIDNAQKMWYSIDKEKERQINTPTERLQEFVEVLE